MLQARGILAETAPIGQTDFDPPTPTFTEIMNAPDDQWRQLAILADANLAFCERARARHQTNLAHSNPGRPQRKHRRPRPGRSNRHWSAASVLSQVGPAIVETLERVKADDETPVSEPTSTIEGV